MTASREASRSRRRLVKLLRRERELLDEGRALIAGVDEAGMGPLAGPVVVAAVILPPGEGIAGVDDSKVLAPARREALAAAIRERALAWSIVEMSPSQIDLWNIYRAALEGMRRAVLALAPRPEFVLVDARTIPHLGIPQEGLIRGDSRCHAIAAASILAKTARDARMNGYEADYPGYGFAEHKGYPTPAHRDALARLGPSPIHRRSFTLLPHPRLFD